MALQSTATHLLLGALVCLSLLSGVAVTVPDDEVGVVSIEQYGSGVALEDEPVTYLWQSEPYVVGVRFASNATDSMHTVCLQVDRDDLSDSVQEEYLNCHRTSVDEDGYGSVALAQEGWSENVTGDMTLEVAVYEGSAEDGEPLSTESLPVHVFRKDDDLSGNGLSNEREIEIGTHPERADTDTDGLTDGIEVMLGTDPRDSATPYKLTVASIGALTTAAFLFVLLAGRALVALRSIAPSSVASSTPDDPTDAADAESGLPTFEPPIRDEERVRQLLEDHGGRLKQSQVVEATDWSKSKVSRLLSSMEDEGEITRIRLGRENLVCLRGHEPPDVTPSWKE